MGEALTEKAFRFGSEDVESAVEKASPARRQKGSGAAYYKAWLAAHPDRSEEWLKERSADGFQIHHVDGDHGNNHPGNLVLIEGIDHMRLHGLFRLKKVSIPDKKAAAKGGRSMWGKMTKTQRSRWAKRMAKARWKESRAAKQKARAKEMAKQAKQRKAAHKARKVAAS